MKVLFSTALVAIAILISSAADAALLHYSITGMSSQATRTISFNLDTTRTPDDLDPGYAGYFDLPGSFSPYQTADVYFYSQAAKGGFFIGHYLPDQQQYAAFADAVGDALFTGPTDDPTFLTGRYTAIGNPDGPFAGRTYTIDVTAVPEPANWAMTIGGIGVLGGVMRRRRSMTVRAART